MRRGECKCLPPLKSHGRWATKSIAVVTTVALLVACNRDASGRSDTDLEFGVLGSTCAADRVDALKRAGVTVAQVDVLWDQLEPASDRIDHGYADKFVAAMRNCQEAGIKVVLGLGVQYAPNWVNQLPGGGYVDQAGNSHPGRTPNLVFGADVRRAFEDHAANVVELLPAGSVHAIRLGTSEVGELGYPRSKQQDTVLETRFWAFDSAAQTGIGLPDGVDRSPMPDWKPGVRTWRGEAVTAEQVTTWFDWYSSEATDAVLWQAEVLRELGFTGSFHVPLAGRGALPEDLRRAINSALDGTGDRDGSLERGLYYPDQLRALKEQAGTTSLIADVTSLDDATAVQARMRRPATDTCQPMDHRIDLVAQPDVDLWSAARWTIANARRSGLEVIGENPGSPYAASTGGSPESDNLRSQMDHAPRYAAECGLSAFFWAFEDDLFNNQQYAGLDDYRKTISVYR